ncbi:MAG: HAMP domain-containing protein [Planctomycetes bacterium]|nr:HAMP domain-containing protein [Planctomycetota bacterium]
MQLRTRLALIVALVVAVYALGDLALQRLLLLPRFEELERAEAATDVLRVERALSAEIAALDARCSEWAAWDGANQFVAGAPAQGDFRAHHLSPERLRASRIELLYLVAADGRVVFGDVRDPSSGESVRLPELDFEQLSVGHPFLAQDRVTPTQGLALTARGPLLVASRAFEGPQGGTVILGRMVADELLALLRERTEVDFDLLPIELASRQVASELMASITASADPVVRSRDEQTLDGWAAIDDLRGRPALLVQARLPRSISAGGRDALRYALISTVAAGLLLLVVLLTVLRRTVVDPLATLTRHAVAIGRTDDYARAVALERGDEIGTLSREFERMMHKLEASRSELVTTARAAGMSEIATGILHNVGNVLNSVNVSAELVEARLRDSRLHKLERLSEFVRAQGERFGEFVASDPRGRHFAPFLLEVADGLKEEHAELAREVRSLAQGVEHIGQLVAAQQDFARRSELREQVELGTLVDMAWDIVARSSSGPLPQLRLEIADLGRVPVDRHKLVQVLVNLLKNARESIAEAGRVPGEVRVHIAGRGEFVRIEVHDDGLGIPPENVARLFRHGFTTKTDGNGIGLHSCANAATEMGGTLHAQSAGVGHGACFVLDLPLSARAAA